MMWPWVSRARLDAAEANAAARIADARAEIEWLRMQCASLSDQLVRVMRKDVGLPEIPRQPKPALQPMPKELLAYYNGLANPSLSKFGRDQAYRRHASGHSWDEIMADVMQPEEPVLEGIYGGE